MSTGKSFGFALMAGCFAMHAGFAVALDETAIAWEDRGAACPMWPSSGKLIILSEPAGILLDDQILLLEGGAVSSRLVSLPGLEAPPWEGKLTRPSNGSVTIELRRNGCTLRGTGPSPADSRADRASEGRSGKLVEAWQRIAQGERAAVEGRFAEAKDSTATGCEQLGNLTGNASVHVAACLVRLSNRARDANDLSSAQRLAADAARWYALKAGEQAIDTLAAKHAEAQALYALSRRAEALEIARAVSEGRKQLLGDNHPDTLASMNVIAVSLRALGRIDEAIEILEEILRRMEVSGDIESPLALRFRNNLANALSLHGNPERAVPLQERNWKARSAVLGSAHPDTLNTLRNLANALRLAGDEARAMRILESSLPDFVAAFGPASVETLRAQRLLALLYYSVNRMEEAAALGLSVYSQMSDQLGPTHVETMQALNNLANAEVKSGRMEAGIRHLRESLENWTRLFGRDHPNTRIARASLGFALLRSTHYRDALDVFEAGPEGAPLPPRGSTSVHVSMLIAHAGAAQARYELGQREEALRELRDVYERKRELLGPDHLETVDTLAALADLCDRAGRREEAVALLEELVERTEGAISGGVLREYQRAVVTSRVGDSFQKAGYTRLSTLLASANPQRALAVAELSKMRGLSDALGRSIGLRRQSAKERGNLQRIAIALAKAEEAIASAEPGTLAQATALADRVRLQEQAIQLGGAEDGVVQEADLTGGNLPSDAAFLSFVASGDHLVAFVVRSDREISAHDLGRFPRLADSVDAVRRMTASPAPDTERVWRRNDSSFIFALARPEPDAVLMTNASSAVDDLARRLIGPLLPALQGTTRWIISPDGPLAFLEFESLKVNGRTLIERVEISYAPSLTVIGLLQQRAGRVDDAERRQAFLGIAVSNFSAGQPRAGGMRWNDLPRSEEEVREIARTFGATSVRTLMGTDATELSVKDMNESGELAQVRVLHLATHAYLSPRSAKLSALVFSPSTVDGITRDGIISAAELAAFRLNADLVVLSACETGVGQSIVGEGVIGLPYAIMTAGAQSAVMSLWQVVDESAAEFMVRFYRRLNAGMTPSKALRETKLELMRSKGPWSAPRHWAPFVLYGAP